MPNVGLQFWIVVWTPHYGWTPRLDCAVTTSISKLQSVLVYEVERLYVSE